MNQFNTLAKINLELFIIWLDSVDLVWYVTGGLGWSK